MEFGLARILAFLFTTSARRDSFVWIHLISSEMFDLYDFNAWIRTHLESVGSASLDA